MTQHTHWREKAATAAEAIEQAKEHAKADGLRVKTVASCRPVHETPGEFYVTLATDRFADPA